MANVDGTFYSGESQRPNTTPVSPPNAGDDPVYPINPPGTTNTTLYKLLGDVTDSDFIGKNGRVPVVNDENVLTLEHLPQLQENGLISGGIVQWTGIGYIFNVSGAFYRIAGVYYESPPIQITLATPDVTNNRIDVFAVDINGVALDITGTPSGSPVKPQIDPQTQLELTSVIVTASSTTPTLTEEVIYDENTEWTGSSTGTGTVAFNSAVDPFQGSASIEATNIQNGLKIRLTDGSDYDLSTVQTLGLQINLKATMGAGINIGVTFLNSSGSPISTELILTHDKKVLGYQFVGIALSQFSFTSFLARSIEFRYIRTKGTIIYSGFFLDIIKLEGGINPPLGVSSFLALSDTPSTYSGQAGKTVAVKADESGLEFVTGGGGASTFLSLTDTPSTYVGQANKWTRVNLGETALVFDTVSPYDLDQEGATDGQVVTWVAANSRYEPTTFAGSSNWTIVGSDIYRNSSVAIGRTTIPTNATLGVQSLIATGGSIRKYFQLLDSTGLIEHLSIDNYGSFKVADKATIFGGATTNLANQGHTFKGSGSNGVGNVFRILSNTDVVLFEINSSVSNPIAFPQPKITVGSPSINLAADGSTFKGSGSNGATSVFTIQNSLNVKLLDIFSNIDGQSGFSVYSQSLNVGNPTLKSFYGATFKGSASSIDTRYIFTIMDSSENIVFRISGSKLLTYFDGLNQIFGTVTGTKFGTTTNQKLSFWNKTPIIQPTTAITGATRVGGGGTTITDTDTFGGYTIAKAIAAMINTGLLA